jgi:DNA-binding NarL/FixJ family response regulator
MRIVLANRQARVRFALRALLEQQSNLSILGEASDTESLLDLARTACPDMVLLDWKMQGQAIPNLLIALRQQCPEITVIVLSSRPEMRQAALAASADAFVSKADPPERLLEAIQAFAKVDREPTRRQNQGGISPSVDSAGFSSRKEQEDAESGIDEPERFEEGFVEKRRIENV